MDDYLTTFVTNNNSESIFALEYNVGGEIPQRSFGMTSVPLEESDIKGNTGWDDFYPEINFFLNAPKCTRTNETFHSFVFIPSKNKAGNIVMKKVPWSSDSTHATHPYYNKFRAGLASVASPRDGDGCNENDTTIFSMAPSTNKCYDFIRYAYVLLDFAEADAMANGLTNNDYDQLNKVRIRAGETPYAYGTIPSAKAFQDTVVHERAYEAAGEFGVRWFDIVRLQMLPQVIAARVTLTPPAPLSENKILNTDYQDKYLAPIPIDEMTRNPGWTQNPSY
jgi:hypothetical protein